VGRYLRERRPDVVVVGADPEGSVFSGGPVVPYLTEGIGEDFWPETYDIGVADLIVRVPDRDAFLTARAATAAEGILFGESGGTALWAALQVARDVDDPDALVVVLIADSGRNYIGKLYNDAWLREAGILGPEEDVTAYNWQTTRPAVVIRRD
jgi:cystathionine beta-synthase